MCENIDERIKKIHDKSVIVDAHFDLLMEVELRRRFGYRKVIETTYLEDILEGGVDVLVCSLFIDNMYLPEMGLKKALDEISALYAEIEESPDKIMLCTCYDDILKAKGEGKLAILLSFEGVDPLTNDLELLNIFYKLGVRLVGFTWSRRNFAADGCHFAPKEEGVKGGLTEFGVRLIKMAEKLNMIIDVSHINDEGFWDVMKIAKTPVIASHSNCRSITDSMRNLDDDQIIALAQTGGIMGMNGRSSFISCEQGRGDADHLVQHVDHIVKLAGVEHVGLGLDICDFLSEINIKPANRNVPGSYDVIPNHKDIKKFTASLIKHGYSDEEIGLILGGNFLNLYKNILK